MKPDIKWINTSKPRKTINIIGNREDTVYPAHSVETHGFVPYVSKRAWDQALDVIKKCSTENQEADKFLREIEE